MRAIPVVVFLLFSTAARADSETGWAEKNPAAAQALAAIAREMKVGASNFGGWADKYTDDAQKLAAFLEKPGKVDPRIEDPIADAAENKLQLDTLTAVYMRQMTFPVFAKAFWDWARKYPDASYTLLTTPGAARAALPAYDEWSAPPPANAAAAVDQVFGNLERAGDKDRYDKWDQWPEISSLPRPATGGDLHRLALDAARDYFSKFPYHRNEDNARNQVVAVVVTDKGWVDQGTDISRKYTGSDGLEHPMHRRGLGILVIVNHDQGHCLALPDALIELRAESPGWSGPDYFVGSDERTKRIDCAKVKRQ